MGAANPKRVADAATRLGPAAAMGNPQFVFFNSFGLRFLNGVAKDGVAKDGLAKDGLAKGSGPGPGSSRGRGPGA